MVLYIPELNVIILVSLFVYLFNMPFNLVALILVRFLKALYFEMWCRLEGDAYLKVILI